MKFTLPLSEQDLQAWCDGIRASAYQTPYFHLKGYMNRYFVAASDRDAFQAGAGGHVRRLHEILRSDNDRHLHDHPWPYTTVILEGGYFEETPLDPKDPTGPRRTEWHAPGSVITRRAKDAHRLIIPDGQTCTTLFMTGPKQRSWGFHTEAGWVQWRHYLDIPPHLNSAGHPVAQNSEAAQ